MNLCEQLYLYLLFEFDANITSVIHVQRDTYYIFVDSEIRYILKYNLSLSRLNSIQFCIQSLVDCSDDIGFAFPRIFFIGEYCSASLVVFEYLVGEPLLVEMVPYYYSKFAKLACDKDSLSFNYPLFSNSIDDSFFYSLRAEIIDIFLDDPFMCKFLSFIQNEPPDLSLAITHGDYIYQNFLVSSPSPGHSCYSIIDWEFSGVSFSGFDFAWLSTLTFHQDQVKVENIPISHPNHLFFMYLSFLRIIQRLRVVQHRNESHLVHEMKALLDFKSFLEYFGFEQQSFFLL